MSLLIFTMNHELKTKRSEERILKSMNNEWIRDFPIWIPLLLLPPMILMITQKLNVSKKNLPPGPPSLPIIGNIHQLGLLPHKSISLLHKKYGPILHLKIFSLPVVVVSSPESAKHVLKLQETDCCKFSATVQNKLFYNYNIFSYKDVRKICVTELLSVKRVQSFKHIREDELCSLIKSISQSASKGIAVNLSEKITKLSGNVACRMVFGTSLRGTEIEDKFSHIMDEVAQLLASFCAADYFPLIGRVFDRVSGFHKRLEMSFCDLDAFLEQAIADNLKDKDKKEKENESLIRVLLKMEKDQVQLGNERLHRNHIKAIFMNLFLAGVNSVAASMIWTMTELGRHPRVRNKVQSEIRDHIGKKGYVAEEDTYSFEYLKMVMKEIYRMYPAGAYLNPRKSVSKFQVDKYNVYSKSLVLVGVWELGRDPKLWKDPDEFIPERFIDNPVDFKGTFCEYVPFGLGRRSCPGQYMANNLVEYILANILYHFDWKLPNGMKEEDISIEETPGMNLNKKIHLELVPVMR